MNNKLSKLSLIIIRTSLLVCASALFAQEEPSKDTSRSISQAEEQFSNPAPRLRYQAISAMGVLAGSDSRALTVLTECFAHQENYTKWLCGEELVKNEARAYPFLLMSLTDNRPEVRRSSALTFERLSILDESAISALNKALNDTNPDVRSAAALALGKHKIKDSIPLVIKAMRRDVDLDRVTEFAQAFEYYGGIAREALPDLEWMVARFGKYSGETGLKRALQKISAAPYEYPSAVLSAVSYLGDALLPIVNKLSLEIFMYLLGLCAFGLICICLKLYLKTRELKRQNKTNYIEWQEGNNKLEIALRYAPGVFGLSFIPLLTSIILGMTFVLLGFIRYGIHPDEVMVHFLLLIVFLIAILVSIYLLILCINSLYFRKEIKLGDGIASYERKSLISKLIWKLPLSDYQGIYVKLYKGRTKFGSYQRWSVILKHDDKDKDIVLYLPVNEYCNYSSHQEQLFVRVDFIDASNKFAKALNLEFKGGLYHSWLSNELKAVEIQEVAIN